MPHSTVIVNDHNPLGAVILVGGQSLRMGQDKSQLQIGGTTFLQKIVERIAPAVGPIVIVGKPEQNLQSTSGALSLSLPKNEIDFANDRFDDKGPLDGIQVGLKHLEDINCTFGFVSSCDVPLIKPEIIQFLFAQIGSSPAIVPSDEAGKIYGMTAIYRTRLHRQIGKLIERNQLRVSNLAAHLAARQISVAELRVVDPQLESLININRAEDYAALLKRLTE